jgi:hypothetical protein
MVTLSLFRPVEVMLADRFQGRGPGSQLGKTNPAPDPDALAWSTNSWGTRAYCPLVPTSIDCMLSTRMISAPQSAKCIDA